MEWIDTHCHLDEDAFCQDCGDAVARAVDAGVVAMIAIGITLDSCRRVIELTERLRKRARARKAAATPPTENES